MPPISADRWRVLSPYLDEALEIAPDERAGWLASISAHDPVLAADLRTMLAQHQMVHETGFLEHAVLDSSTARIPSLAGQVVGAYRLISPIGQGGTGSVPPSSCSISRSLAALERSDSGAKGTSSRD